MLEKYRATIHGNTIEWNDDVPDEMKNNDGVGVYVTLIENRDDSAEPNGKRAVENPSKDCGSRRDQIYT